MSERNLACIVGARPNFMKMAPLLSALERHPHVRSTLIHTGQHYDAAMSQVFFDELGIRPPDISLEVGSGRQGAQTARALERLESAFLEGPPGGGRYDRVVVVGDVNSTLAAALAASKLQIPVAHVEAGLRSFDRSMPEEINRILTDAISDMLLVSDPAGLENLRSEGRPEGQMHLVGNIMIDTLRRRLPGARERSAARRHGLEPKSYGFVTLHRPSNVDSPDTLAGIVSVLVDVAHTMPIVFPVHPRTSARLKDSGLLERLNAARGIMLLEPLGYLDCLSLTSEARVVVTDSGGLQEESTALEVPCLTMRENTERPITVTEGTSTLVGNDAAKLQARLTEVLEGTYKSGRCPELWDGRASERIAGILVGERETVTV